MLVVSDVAETYENYKNRTVSIQLADIRRGESVLGVTTEEGRGEGTQR
jgi:hypothetical protein